MIVNEKDFKEIAVSVIVPAYNAEDTLKDTLDSILAQTLKNIEIIVINDGSSDKTKDIIEEYKGLFPEKIIAIHKENEGVSIARNTGLEIAKGEYVGFVDADDTVNATMFEKMYLHAVKCGSDLVQCWRYDVSPESEKVRGPKKGCTGVSIYDNPQIISSQTLFVWDKIFRRSIIEEHDVRFEKYRYAEDVLFIFSFEIFAKNIEELKEALYFYQVRRSGSVTASFGDSLLDIPKALGRMNEVAFDRGCFSQIERYLWRLESHYFIRRINDFYLYYDPELQEKLAKGFFDLFDMYFWNWKQSILYVATKTKFRARFQRYRSDWDKMLRFIHQPIWVKRVCRKPLHIYEKCVVFPDKIKRYIKGFKRKIKKIQKYKKDHQYSSRYAKYLSYPIKENAVLLVSYYGSSFSDSIYYMAQDLVNRGGIEVYIGTNNPHREMIFSKFNHLDVHLVQVFSEEYLEILATAKYLVNNSRFPAFFVKRKGQIYLNTWHGTPLKALGRWMKSGLKDVGNNQSNFLMCDYLLYPNEYTCEKMLDSFFLDELYTGEVLLCGYPRNSIFYKTVDSEKIKKDLGIQGKKVYIYMPTWRGEALNSASIEEYKVELTSMLEELDQLLNEDVVLFVKLHQVVMRKIPLAGKYQHIRTGHPYYENYHFLSIADGLITDYSSVFFDFANSRKEILLFTYDYEKYIAERGVYFDISELPFQKISTVQELADAMNQNVEFAPDENYQKFLIDYCSFDGAGSAIHANDVLLHGHTSSNEVQIKDYSQNSDKEYTLYLMSNLSTPSRQSQFQKMISADVDKKIFVFAQWSFEKCTNDILSQCTDKKIKYIITQGEMPCTLFEGMALLVFRKTGIMKKVAQKIYKRELQRLFPNVKIAEIQDYSNDQKFHDIFALFKEGLLGL